jgi:TonB-dependent receptor
MNTIFLRLSRILTLICLGFACVTASARAQSGSLADEWGWIPERAGILAAESWGIKPQWSGKTLVEAYQLQRQAGAGNRMVRNVIAPVDALPNLPPPVLIPVPQGFCEVIGEVSNDKLEPVAGAIVQILGTTKTVETNADGVFTFSALASGNITIEATKPGYVTDSQSATALPGQKLTINIVLKFKAADGGSEETMMEEETVVGEYQESNSGDLLIDIQNTSSIASGISKAEFTAAAVSDAAGAVSKISGANIVGGKYAVVRGLGDRYSNTLVNGALISSADPSKKAVQLDLFPSDLLQSVAINKTYTPALPAEFAGGIVLIETLRLPEKRIIDFEFGTKTNTNFNGKFYENPDGKRGFLGERDDDIPLDALPDGMLSKGWTGRRPPGVRPEGGVSTQEQLRIAAEAAAQMQAVHASGGMSPKERTPEEQRNFGFTLGDRFELSNGIEVGGVVAFTHEVGDNVQEGVEVGRGIDYGSDLKPGTDGTPGTEDFVVRTQQEDQYTAYTNWGLLIGAGIKLNDNHEIGFTKFENVNAQDKVTRARKIKTIGGNFPEYLTSDSNPFGAGAYTYQAFDAINPLVRQLKTRQLDGTHKFGPDDKQVQLDWLTSSSDALEERPNGRTFFFSELDFADPRIAGSGDVYNPSLGTQLTSADPYSNNPPLVESFRESLNTKEEATNNRLDLTIPLWEKSENKFFDIKIGANHFSRDREVRGRLFTYSVPPALNNALLGNNGAYGVEYWRGIDGLYDPDGSNRFLGWTGPQASSQSPDLIMEEATTLGRTVRNVDAGNAVNASYLMANTEISGWGVTGGLRLESEERFYQVLPEINPIAFVNAEPVVTENTYILPGITIWRNFGAEDEFRATYAWSRTVARPTFYEYAPVEIQDQATGDIIIGNPALVDTMIENFDLRFDWRTSDRNRLSFNLFHKNMSNPIAQAYELEKKTWVNGENGMLTGFEIEASHYLGAGFSVTTNYTKIDSLLRYIQKINSLGDSQVVDSTFEGQPENIFNLILGYDHEELGLTASIVYNFTDSYLVGVPATVESPVITRKPFHSLDFVLSKSFSSWSCDTKVTFKVANLLNYRDTQVFAPTDLVFNSFSPGRSYSLGVDIEF